MWDVKSEMFDAKSTIILQFNNQINSKIKAGKSRLK